MPDHGNMTPFLIPTTDKLTLFIEIAPYLIPDYGNMATLLYFSLSRFIFEYLGTKVISAHYRLLNYQYRLKYI